jgi:hypothetical protein
MMAAACSIWVDQRKCVSTKVVRKQVVALWPFLWSYIVYVHPICIQLSWNIIVMPKNDKVKFLVKSININMFFIGSYAYKLIHIVLITRCLSIKILQTHIVVYTIGKFFQADIKSLASEKLNYIVYFYHSNINHFMDHVYLLEWGLWTVFDTNFPQCKVVCKSVKWGI